MDLFKVYEAVWDDANDFAENTTQYYQDYAEAIWNIFLTDEQSHLLVEVRKNWENCDDKNGNEFFYLVQEKLESVEIN